MLARQPMRSRAPVFCTGCPLKWTVSGCRMKRSGPIPRRARLASKKPMRKRSKSPAKFAQQYGSWDRVIWVKARPCAACGVVGYSENAHVGRRSGMGRKGPYTDIAPLCGPRPDPWPTMWMGCHDFRAERPREFAAAFPNFDPEAAAAATHAAWIASHPED